MTQRLGNARLRATRISSNLSARDFLPRPKLNWQSSREC